MKKLLKDIYILIIGTILSICGFGGGCLFYLLFCIIFGIENINKIIFILCIFAPMPFCWWIAPKFSQKYFFLKTY